MKPFDISQAEYEEGLRGLEDLMEEVGAQTTSQVAVSRSTLLDLISFRLAHATVDWEEWTGSQWPSRAIRIKAMDE